MFPPLLVLAGSARQQSLNRKLAHVATGLARERGADVTHIELGEFDLPLYHADLEARGTPASVMRLKHLMSGHPAWIICTPEYNAGVPPLLKNALDWVSSPVKSDPLWSDRLRATRGKVVGLLSASPGALGGLRAQGQLGVLLLNLHCWLAPQNHTLSHADDAFDALGVLLREADGPRIQAVVDQVLWAAGRLAPDAGV